MNESGLGSMVTPACIIDKPVFEHNIQRMRSQVEATGVQFRPHVKTLKSVQAAAYYAPPGCPITVSTLAEARAFGAAGYSDILYAVTITPNKVSDAIELTNQGLNLTLVADSMNAVDALIDAIPDGSPVISVAIELDTDGERAGLSAFDEHLVNLARRIVDTDSLHFQGVVTHAGASYQCFTPEQHRTMAKQEQTRLLSAVGKLEQAGIYSSMRSLGSTPTALVDMERSGVTEIRAGVFATFDCVMANLGVCELSDIALKVLTRVIKVDTDKCRVLIDAGWTALSRDNGTQGHWRDCGYGLVCDIDGNVLDGWRVTRMNQEHGIIEPSSDDVDPAALFQFGQMLFILPVHACATAAQFSQYHVTDGARVIDCWANVRGW